MKVYGGLVGITLNPSVRTKFVLISPELARLAIEAEEIAGLSPGSQHVLSAPAMIRHEKSIADLAP
jgi:hypothetical protein